MLLSEMDNKKVKIILIRHAGVKIPRHIPLYAKEIGKFVERYKYAEIKKEMPSLKITKILNDSDKVFSSNLKRSVDSLALLGKTADVQDGVFNEVELPYCKWRWFKLYPDIWLMLFRTAWLVGYSSHSESFKEAKIRAEDATLKLLKSSTLHPTVTLLGHGVMNKLIGRELVKNGWKKQGGQGMKNWSYMVFEK